VVKENLVMTFGAYARRDFALILRAARPEAENYHHEVIKARALRATVHPSQAIAGDVSER
jgi:hypothetical protein